MRRNVLLLGIIILITAAGAAVTCALTAPSAAKESLKAYFVTPDDYAEEIKGRSKKTLDTDLMRFEGESVPYDAAKNTIYIPQSLRSEEWEGRLSSLAAGSRIYITCEEDQTDGSDQPADFDKKKSIAGNRTYRIALITGETYMEGKLIFTGLPVVLLSYDDGEIVGKEAHSGRITVIDPGRSEHSASACSFHMRGNTSVLFDKKSYRITLRDSVGSKNKVSYLGMRTDDDWILNSLSTDRSLCREKVCYDLWEQLNEMEEEPVRSASMEYAELFMNNAYQGVYGLMTPVDGKLMGMTQGDLLYKVRTWKEEMTAPGKLTDYNGERQILNVNGFAYAEIEYPGRLGGAYIWDPMEAYQDFVFETGDLQELNEKGVSIDAENFMLHALFCEMTRAADNTWKNLYLAARKGPDGVYTLSETIWDLNYTFGDQYVWDLDNGNTVFNKKSSSGYQIRYDRDYGSAVLEYVDPDYRSGKIEKWKQWRSNGIGPEFIADMFENERMLLTESGAALRNEERWPGSTDADFAKIDTWIGERFRFLDEMYNGVEGK